MSALRYSRGLAESRLCARGCAQGPSVDRRARRFERLCSPVFDGPDLAYCDSQHPCAFGRQAHEPCSSICWVGSARQVAAALKRVDQLAHRLVRHVGASGQLGQACAISVETIGRPRRHVEYKISDPVSGQEVPVGAAGELLMRGYFVMSGYLDLPQATREAVDSDGWLHTGDLATREENGYLRITGRLKEIINRGGRKIAPGEIEALLNSHPTVALSAVIGVPDRRLGEEIAAFVRPAPAQPRPRRSSPDSAANSWRPSNGPVTGSSSTNYRSRGPAKSTSPRSAKSSTLGDTNDPADAAAALAVTPYRVMPSEVTSSCEQQKAHRKG